MVNGKEKKYSFKLALESKKNINLKYLKELITKAISTKKELNSLVQNTSIFN